jgi:catechol-2,3-dioxygenase
MEQDIELESQMNSWPTGVAAITLFVEDLEAARQFYSRAFDLPVFFEDADSVSSSLGARSSTC